MRWIVASLSVVMSLTAVFFSLQAMKYNRQTRASYEEIKRLQGDK